MQRKKTACPRRNSNPGHPILHFTSFYWMTYRLSAFYSICKFKMSIDLLHKLYPSSVSCSRTMSLNNWNSPLTLSQQLKQKHLQMRRCGVIKKVLLPDIVISNKRKTRRSCAESLTLSIPLKKLLLALVAAQLQQIHYTSPSAKMAQTTAGAALSRKRESIKYFPVK